MRILLLAALVAQDRAGDFFDAVRFEESRPESPAGERVDALLRSKEHWAAAHRAIEARLGPMRPVSLTVAFDYEGEETAKASARGGLGRIRFNLKKLEEYQVKLDEFEAKKKELAGTGRKLVFKVAPARIDRVIWHELTHVFHADYPAPDWFTEGLAQWLSEDPNTIQAFALAGREVKVVDAPPVEKNDVYARGHLFWSWVAARGAVKRAVQATVLDGGAWRPKLEEALGLGWATIQAAEREWSAKEVEKVRERQR